MSTISSGTTLTTALVQTGDTTGNLVIKTGSSNTTAMTISGTDQSVTLVGSLTANTNASTITTGTVPTARLASGTANSSTYLRGDQTWAAVPAATPGGSTTQVQYNNAGAFGGDSGFVYSSGNVGIGTSSPTTQKLHISATSVSGPSNNPAGLRITDTGTNENIQLVNRSGNMLANVESGNSYSWQIADTEVAGITSAGLLQFNSGYGSVATAYGCRAWVNFNGSGGGIRSSGNVTSISVNGTGRYTVNMTTALPDANYSRVVTASGLSGDGNGVCANTDVVSGNSVTATTTAFGILLTISGQSGYRDSPYVSAAVFR